MKKFKGSLYLYSGAVNGVNLAFAFYRDAFDARFMKNHEGGGLQMEIFGYDAYIIQLDRLVVLCFSYLFFSFPLFFHTSNSLVRNSEDLITITSVDNNVDIHAVVEKAHGPGLERTAIVEMGTQVIMTDPYGYDC